MNKKMAFTLVEGPRRTGNFAANFGKTPRILRSAGFTLAEVLITLGVVGVVAAMTIPSLVSNYQKKIWTTQLQKSYATIQQGFKRMLADDNTTALSQTETFLSLGQNGYCSRAHTIDSDSCSNFYVNLRKYFKVADIRKLTSTDNYKYTELDGNNSFNYTDTVIIFIDGTMIMSYNFFNVPRSDNGGMMNGSLGDIVIDINGIKKPNKFGRDIFAFSIGDTGGVYPVGSKAFSVTEMGGDDYLAYWKTTDDPVFKCQNDGQSLGYGCAARVLEEGKMNY